MEEDLNAKLLAVVGGGNKEDKSSSKSSKKKSTKRRKKKKDSSDEEGEISEESEEEFFDEEPVQKPLKKRKMEEESDEEKFNDGYDSDLMGDDKDREYLSKLSEIDREEILAERYSKRQELLERFKLKQRLKREKDKREGRSSRNTPTRTKVQKESKVSALQDIKKRRAKASQATASSGDEEEIKDEGEDEEGEEEEVDSEDDFVIKVDKERSRKEVNEDLQAEESKEEEKKKEEPVRPLDYSELVSVCLKREFFENQVYEPYFDKLVENCFVRMGIGTNNEKPVYRVAQIVEVKEGSKKYKLGNKKTNKQFLLRHGSSTKNFTFECISNHRPLEPEYHKWCSEMERANLHVMTNKEVKEKLQEIKESRNFQYTEEATVERINRKKENLGKPINIAAERVKLLVQRDVCRDVGDEEGFNRFVEQIAQLDQLTKEGKTTIDKAFFINNRNQSMNQARTDVSEIRGAHFSAHPELDPFSRRKTKPSSVISWLLKGDEGQQNEEKKEDSTKQDDDSNGHNNKKKEEDIDPETLLKQAHDFDITLDAPPPMLQQENQLVETTKKKEDVDNNNNHKTTEETKPKQKKPTLSLTDYKRRMGLF